MISRYELQFSFFSHSITKIAITVAAVLTFSHIVIQLFGQTIPDIFGSVFKDIGAGFILVAAFCFALAWFSKQDHITDQGITQLYHLTLMEEKRFCQDYEQNLEIMMWHGVS